MSDEMRAVRDHLLGEADRFAAASAESLSALQRLADNWPGGGEAGKALKEWAERLPDRDREVVARVRDLAHHLPVTDDSPDDEG